ncbi:MAG: glycosyltransferase family 9 protein, partial [bacterium]
MKENFPKARIHFLTSSLVKNLFTLDPTLHEVIAYPTQASRVLRIFKFFTKIRHNQYDLVIDYQCTPGTAQVSWISRAPYRLGWKMKRRQWAYNLYSEANISPNYVAVQKIKALEELGIVAKPQKLQIYLDKNNLEKIQAYFLKEKIDRQSLKINMTPVGQVQTRQWEIENYVTLAEMLIEKHHATVFFSGKKEDQTNLNALAAQAKYKINVLPVWPLDIFTAFLSQMDLHFSYDNGPKHLAIAVNTPTLSLFATDPPFLWNPINNPNHPFILADVPCQY